MTIMNINLKKLGRGMAALGLPLMLAACGSVSQGIAEDGRSAQTLIFPDIGKSGWFKEGAYPNLENLRNVRPGLDKDQLYALLGAPHFSEGLAGVREWDYVFNFRQPGGGAKVCQYKVLFDRDYLAQSFYWQPQDCERLLDAPVAPAPELASQPVTPQVLVLSADTLFAFGQSGFEDIQPQGLQVLDKLVAQLVGQENVDIGRVEIVGHTDRIGSDPDNLLLSQRRAQTVRDYLVERGLAASKVSVRGVGSAQPVVQCEQVRRDELIACLAPNRRVEVELFANLTSPPELKPQPQPLQDLQSQPLPELQPQRLPEQQPQPQPSVNGS